MIRRLLAPIERAASTNSRCAKTIVFARAKRAMVGTATMASVRPIFHTDSNGALGLPITVTTAMSRSSAGTERIESVKTPIAMSSQPRK